MPTDASSPTELLARLVAFDTTSSKSNLAIVAFIEDYLRRHGIESARVPSPDGQKSNLFATIGPEGVRGVALSGHTDVVPVDGQKWDGDPFVLRAEGGRLYGRGACDMKGFLAGVLAAVPDFARRRLAVPVHLAFSYDEEVGCIGVRPMIAEFGQSLVAPHLVIVGEPTSMRVVDAHKGPVRWDVEVLGRAAHSSMSHLGVNAVAVAARLMTELGRIETELEQTSRDERFEPPYATLQVTRVDGGTATNIIPVSCKFSFDVRATPGVDADAIERRVKDFAEHECLPRMRRVADEADILIARVNSVPAFRAEAGSEAVRLALKLAGQNATHAVSYATEAGLFQDADASAVVCGPGDIAQAHTANEWIAQSELDRCAAFLRRLGDWAETAN